MIRFARVALPFGALQAETARRLGARFLTFELIYWVIFGPYLVAYALDVFEPLGEFGPSVILGLIMPLGDAAVILLLTKERRFGDLLVGALKLYFVMLTISLLRTLAVVVGIMAFVVPGLMLAAWFSLAHVIAVSRGWRDPFRALFESRDLVRGHTIPVLLAFAPMVIVGTGLALLVTAYGGVQDGDPAPWTHPVNIVVDQLTLAVTAMAIVIHDRLVAGRATSSSPASEAPPPSSPADETPPPSHPAS